MKITAVQAALAVCAAAMLSAAPVHAQQDREAPARPSGYLDSPPDAQIFLPPPPEAGSVEAEADMAAFHASRALEGGARWDIAASDAEGGSAHVLEAFACALGARIDPEEAPALEGLIGRAMIDVAPIIGVEKARYERPRPFLEADGPVCVSMSEDFGASGSYPSGHSTVGWTYALLLAELAPDRAAQIVARGRAYAESRVVCGVHYPSDVAGGQLVATTVFAALQSNPEFQADRAAAKAELDALRASAPAPDAERCAAEAEALAAAPW